MYCQMCSYKLLGLPDIHRCPECSFVYVRNVTTSNNRLYSKSLQSIKHWTKVVLTVCFLGYPVIATLYTIIYDPYGHVWKFSESDDPLVIRFDAFIILLFVCIILIGLLSNLFQQPTFWIHSGGAGWTIRGSLKQFIPWGIIKNVKVAPNHKDVLLDLTIGGDIVIPKKRYKKYYAINDLCVELRSRMYKEINLE